MIALVDANNFYCSCERVFNPQLRKRPVIVLSNNDGCAISRSEEAKAIGIEMGARFCLTQQLIKKHNVAVFSSNYALYDDMSKRVFETLRDFAPRIEEYSIDEAFLDLSELKYHDLNELALEIKTKVYKHTGIPVGVGIAPTKTLAKMANRYAKKVCRDIGVFVMDSPEKTEQVLRYTEIGDVWNIGSERAKDLQRIGINYANDLLQVNDDWMRNNMTVTGQRLLNELKGIPCITLEEKPPPKKSIGSSKSFGVLLTDLNEIKQATATYAFRCAEKLRKQKCCAGAVNVSLQTDPFSKSEKHYYNEVTIPLPVTTNDSSEIILYTMYGLNLIFKEGFKYLKSGITLRDIVPEAEAQQSLFDERDRSKGKFLLEAVDGINRSFGRDMIKYARMGDGKKWKMRQAHLSQCYTTRMDQLKKIKN